MDTDGDWRLALEIEEHRMGHIAQAQQQQDGGRLPIEFVLKTAPESSLKATLDEVGSRAEISEEHLQSYKPPVKLEIATNTTHKVIYCAATRSS